jgi:hypothetical protein
MTDKEVLKLALEALETLMLERGSIYDKAITAIKQALAAPVKDNSNYRLDPPGLDPAGGTQVSKVWWDGDKLIAKPIPFVEFYKAAPDLQAELDATNRQVEILSDALAESRREVAALKAVQEPVAAECKFDREQEWLHCEIAHHNLVQSEPHKWPGYQTRLLYTTPPAAQPAPVQEPVAWVSLQWLAEMILSDCGHSSNYTPLLDRVKARIEQWERANSAPTPPAAQRQWVNPNEKSQKQFLPHIGEPVLFCHDGVTYFGKHTGGSFTTGQGITTRNFNTWECHWMYPPSAKLKEKNNG